MKVQGKAPGLKNSYYAIPQLLHPHTFIPSTAATNGLDGSRINANGIQSFIYKVQAYIWVIN